MSSYALFTSESVSEGHPDKVSDQVSDAILDLYLAKDPNARVAVETLVKTGMAVVAGEVTSSATVTPGEIESAVRSVICDIGYDSSDVCFDGNTCAVINAIGLQSADIAMGTHEADEASQGARSRPHQSGGAQLASQPSDASSKSALASMYRFRWLRSQT